MYFLENIKKIYSFLIKFDIIHFHELWSFKPIIILFFANHLGIKHFYVGHGYLDKWSVNQKNILKKNYLLNFFYNMLLIHHMPLFFQH